MIEKNVNQCALGSAIYPLTILEMGLLSFWANPLLSDQSVSFCTRMDRQEKIKSEIQERKNEGPEGREKGYKQTVLQNNYCDPCWELEGIFVINKCVCKSDCFLWIWHVSAWNQHQQPRKTCVKTSKLYQRIARRKQKAWNICIIRDYSNISNIGNTFCDIYLRLPF